MNILAMMFGGLATAAPVWLQSQGRSDTRNGWLPAAPLVVITNSVEAQDTDGLATCLSALLGSEVVIRTRSSAFVRLESGTFTAREICDRVTSQTKLTWREELELRPISDQVGPALSKLEPLPEITVRGRLAPSRAARLIARDVGLSLRLPAMPAELADFRYEGIPADAALSRIAEAVGCALWRIVIFEPPDSEDGAALNQEREYLDELMEQAERTSRLNSMLSELTHQAADDPGFPWEAVLGAVFLEGLTFPEMASLVGQLQAETEMLRTMRQLEGDQGVSCLPYD